MIYFIYDGKAVARCHDTDVIPRRGEHMRDPSGNLFEVTMVEHQYDSMQGPLVHGVVNVHLRKL